MVAPIETLVDFYICNEDLANKLSKDGFDVELDNSERGFDLFVIYDIPIARLPSYIENHEYEVRDSKTGDFVEINIKAGNIITN